MGAGGRVEPGRVPRTLALLLSLRPLSVFLPGKEVHGHLSRPGGGSEGFGLPDSGAAEPLG